MEMWERVEKVPRRREEQEREPIGDGLANDFTNERQAVSIKDIVSIKELH